MLELLETDLLGLGIDEQDYQELQEHHGAEEEEGAPAGVSGDLREGERNDGVHDPVGGGAEALSFGADRGREDLADVHPDHRALREGEARDESDQQPYEQRARQEPQESD